MAITPTSPNTANASAMMMSALAKLTDQLEKMNDYFKEQDDKLKKVPAVLRDQNEQQMRTVSRTGIGGDALNNIAQLVGQHETRNARQSYAAPIGDRLPPNAVDYQQLEMDLYPPEATADESGGGPSRPRPRRSTPRKWWQRGRDISSMPPDAEGGDGSTDAEDNAKMLSWAVLGEHGGPKAIRNMALDYYGFNRSLDWTHGAANKLNQYMDQGGFGSGILDTLGVGAAGSKLQSLTEAMQNHPALSFAAIGTASALNRNLTNNQALGQSLGYGPPAAGGQTIFGFHNPLGDFGTAAQVGAANNVAVQGLMGRVPGMGFGNGLSEQQAQSTMSSLTSQGFGVQPQASGVVSAGLTALDAIPGVGGVLSGLVGSIFGDNPSGDAVNIAENFNRPLMEKFPGLSAQDLGQFDPMLRNSATSIQQLTDQLSNLGMEARTSKETVGEYASSLAKTGQAFEAMGSSPQGGIAVGTGFTNSTGLDPQVASQFAQSPIMQGMALSQYGILPSGLGDMNSGAFANTTMATLQMMQKATAGINQNKYKTVNGHQVLIQSGQQAQYDQISAMTGIPSNIVKRMLGDMGGNQARANAQEMLGDPTSSTGMFAIAGMNGNKKLSNQQYAKALSQWHDTVDNTWKHTGVSPDEMKRLDKETNIRQRAIDYANDLSKASKDDSWNQIQNNPNAQTVQVQFTGQAANWFQQVANSPSPNKINANAGAGAPYNQVATSIPGDTGGYGVANNPFFAGNQTGR